MNIEIVRKRLQQTLILNPRKKHQAILQQSTWQNDSSPTFILIYTAWPWGYRGAKIILRSFLSLIELQTDQTFYVIHRLWTLITDISLFGNISLDSSWLPKTYLSIVEEQSAPMAPSSCNGMSLGFFSVFDLLLRLCFETDRSYPPLWMSWWPLMVNPKESGPSCSVNLLILSTFSPGVKTFHASVDGHTNPWKLSPLVSPRQTTWLNAAKPPKPYIMSFLVHQRSSLTTKDGAAIQHNRNIMRIIRAQTGKLCC